VPKQPRSSQVIIPLNCYSVSQKATPTDPDVARPGQSEPAATNAPVPRSIHWMDGLRFFIRRQMGFISVQLFLLMTTAFLFIYLIF
jgi:hypothetical protein